MNKSCRFSVDSSVLNKYLLYRFLLLLAHFAPGHTVTDGHADP